MKQKSDPRHLARIEAVKRLFEKNFRPRTGVKTGSLAAKVLSKQKDIDAKIKRTATAWPIEQIAPVDAAILRLAIYELLYKEEKEPYKVIIDEAVEIAKEFGGESSAAFVNGVLGSIVKSEEAISN